jgi:hypothetical protein
VSFVLNPAKRRAVIRAIEFIEQQDGPRANYGNVRVIGSEPSYRVMAVTVDTGCTPPGRRFVAVGIDGRAEELDYEHVAAAYGVQLWL